MWPVPCMTITATKDLSINGKAKALIEGADEITNVKGAKVNNN